LYLRPVQLDEALQNLAQGARALAGATDLLPAAGELGLEGAFVDVSRLEALRGISRDANCIRIGGATTWSEIARADLPPAFRALQAAAREIGAVQIQSRGTLAGNLCNASPAADGVPPLLILDAVVELASRLGVRRLPLRDFLLGSRKTVLAPDELMTAVICPAPPENLRSAFVKLGARRYLVISIAMVAVALEIADGAVRDARIAVGACSATAMRLPAAEARLLDASADASLADRLRAENFAALTPIDDVRATKEYRVAAALELTRRAIKSCLNGESGGVV
jgi:CO/xanthine dehydrogenase FAD-binding subunit